MKKNGRQRGPEATAMSGRSLSRWQRPGAGRISGCALALLALLTLASCGGVDSVAGGGIGGTGTISVGPISALGSIFVNGIEFDTTTATVDLNGSQANGSVLQVGMVVTVDGTVNADGRTGMATSVVYDDNLQGPITAIDQASGTMTVLNQTIRTDSGTLFVTGGAMSGLAGLGQGDIVAVSGLPMDDGSIHATRISQQAAGSEFQISGPVEAATGTTFMINGQIVDISQLSSGMGMPSMNGNGPQNRTNGTVPQNGDIVAVIGELNGEGIMIASKLRMLNSLPTGNRQMGLTGYIQTASDGSFTMGASMMGKVTVLVTPETVFSTGSADDLRQGAQVRVTGSMSMGTITAQEISF